MRRISLLLAVLMLPAMLQSCTVVAGSLAWPTVSSWFGGDDADPAVYAARQELADALSEGRVKDARRLALDHETTYRTDPIVLILAAEAHQADGYDQDALDGLSRAVELEAPADVRSLALRNRAALLMRLEMPQEAYHDLIEAEALGMDDPFLAVDVGAAAYASGDFEAARGAWSRLDDAQRQAIADVVGPGFFDEPFVVTLP